MMTLFRQLCEREKIHNAKGLHYNCIWYFTEPEIPDIEAEDDYGEGGEGDGNETGDGDEEIQALPTSDADADADTEQDSESAGAGKKVTGR